MFKYETDRNSVGYETASVSGQKPVQDGYPNLRLVESTISSLLNKARKLADELDEHSLALNGPQPTGQGCDGEVSAPPSGGEIEMLMRGLGHLERELYRIAESSSQIGRARG